jgi:hypothetical protein
MFAQLQACRSKDAAAAQQALALLEEDFAKFLALQSKL